MIINQQLDYSNKTVQADMEKLMKAIESHPKVDPNYSQSWLRDFLDYVERNNANVNEQSSKIDITNDKKFVTALDEVSN